MLRKIHTSTVLHMALMLAVLLSSVAVSSVHASTIIYVKKNALGSNNGTSWKNAYKELRSALAAANAGDEIWVAAGTYKPTAGTDQTISFELKDGVAIYGGFDGTETSLAQRKIAINVTILSGDIGVAGNTSDNSYHVVVGQDVSNSTILNGFTIKSGYAVGAEPYDKGGGLHNNNSSPVLANLIFSDNFAGRGGGLYNENSNPSITNVKFNNNSAVDGGGVYNLDSSPSFTSVTLNGNFSYDRAGGIYNANSSPTLTNVILRGNAATATGGGMYNENGSHANLTNVTFDSNSAVDGGGMSNSSSNPALLNVIFVSNSAFTPYAGGTAYGGGIHNSNASSPSLTDVVFESNSAFYGGGISNVQNSSPTLLNVTFSNNTAKGGAGISNNASHPDLTNVTFYKNKASSSGGGMANANGSSPILTNVTFFQNSAPPPFGGAMSNGNGTTIIRNSIIYANYGDQFRINDGGMVVVAYSIVLGGYPGDGNVDVDPLLSTLASNGGFTKTLALGAGSPAIDAVNPTDCPAIDQRGVSRPQGNSCDMGAYEYEFPKPGTPKLLSPANDSIVSTNEPTLDWQDSNPAAYFYQVQVSTNNLFTEFEIDESSVTDSTFTTGSALAPGKRYYWRVRGFNIDDIPGAWSAVWTFKTPLAQPTLVSPSEAEPLLIDRPAFDWEVVDGANQYTLQVSAASTFSTLLVNATLNATEYTMTKDLPQNKTLFWRVRARSSAVSGAWSKGTFKTGNPPSVPVLVSPLNNALVRDYSPQLNWNNSTVPAGTTLKYYETELDDNIDFSSSTFSTSTVSDFTPAMDLTAITQYYWRVRAINVVNGVDHTSGWSPTWSFRTATPPPTTLIVIPGDPNPLQPTFDWDDSSAAGITGYTIQISMKADFSILLVNSTVPKASSSYTMAKNLPSGKTVHWRVRVNGLNGPSAWVTIQYSVP